MAQLGFSQQKKTQKYFFYIIVPSFSHLNFIWSWYLIPFPKAYYLGHEASLQLGFPSHPPKNGLYPSEDDIILWYHFLQLSRLESLQAFLIMTDDNFSESFWFGLCGAFTFEVPTATPYKWVLHHFENDCAVVPRWNWLAYPYCMWYHSELGVALPIIIGISIFFSIEWVLP